MNRFVPLVALPTTDFILEDRCMLYKSFYSIFLIILRILHIFVEPKDNFVLNRHITLFLVLAMNSQKKMLLKVEQLWASKIPVINLIINYNIWSDIYLRNDFFNSNWLTQKCSQIILIVCLGIGLLFLKWRWFNELKFFKGVKDKSPIIILLLDFWRRSICLLVLRRC